MALRLDVQVVRGEIDNRQRGRVSGRVWLVGRAEPLRLELTGDPWRDLAGCCLEFENPQPQAIPRMPEIATDQTGQVGDITAAKKVRVPDVPLPEFFAEKKRGGKPPEHWANALYLEWFSRSNGRVVIESADYILKPSLPEWTMTVAEEQAQQEKNTQTMRDFLARLTAVIERSRQTRDDDTAAEMDEFGWEKLLRASDAGTDKYMELLDKYGDAPGGQEFVEQEMGWGRPPENLTPEQREWQEEVAAAAEEAAAEAETIPDEAYERDEHPLTVRAHESAMDLWTWCDDRGLLKDSADEDIMELTFKAQMLGAKLAGALNGQCRVPSSPGFVVAALKRVLPHLDAALAAAQRLEAKSPPPVPLERLNEARRELFAIREEILKLMNDYRRKL